MTVNRVTQTTIEALTEEAVANRVTAVTIEGLTEEAAVNQVTAVTIEVLWPTHQEPNQPTLTVTDEEYTTADYEGDAFVGYDGATHTASQWQTDLQTGDFSSPVDDSGEDTTNLTSYQVTGLTESTDYKARVRYKDSFGVWSDWSAAVNFTTDTPPADPTLSIAGTGPDYIDLSGSAFVPGTDGFGHKASQWQVTLSGDPTFTSPVIDTTSTNPATLTSFRAGGLNLFLNQYIARVRYQDFENTWTDWSNTVGPTSILAQGQYYTAYAERPVGTDVREDIPADWDELDTSDGESTWIIETRDDATCLVVQQRDSLDGTVGTVDPLWWQGFPNVDQQIVLARFIFDEAGSGGAPCTGEADPTGLICKVYDGLVALEDFSGATPPALPAGWRVVRGDGVWRTEAGFDWDDPNNQVGTGNALVYYRASGINVPGDDALIVWDGAGNIGQGLVIQAAHNNVTLDLNNDPFGPPGFWWESGWGGLAAMIQSGDSPYYEIQKTHICGIFSTWQHTRIYYYTSPTREEITADLQLSTGWANWEYGKFQANYGAQTWWWAWANHLGHASERRHAYDTRIGQGATGKVGLTFNECPGTAYGWKGWWDYIAAMEDNKITIRYLPEDWRVLMEFQGLTSAWWKLLQSDGSTEQYISFDDHAAPADTLHVQRPVPGDPTKWEEIATFSPSSPWPRVWGGDIYEINWGSIGVGAIAGAAVRLQGTPNGTDGTGYIAYLYDGRFLRLDRWSAAGGLVNLGEVDFAHEPGKYYNVVLEATGSTIRTKAWEGGAGLQGDPEDNDPATWAISVTDATYSTGAPGIVALDDTDVGFDAFATGIGGDPYPKGRNPGAPTWINPSGSIVVDPSAPTLTLEWAAPSVTNDVLGGFLTYELEFQKNGDPEWTSLARDLRDTTYDWTLTGLPAYPDYCVRVRAWAGCEAGPWATVCGIAWLGQQPVKESPDGYFFGDWWTGAPDQGQWIRKFGEVHMDDEFPIHGCLVTREIVPAGVGGECLFQKLYVALTYTTRAAVQVTPILDGDRLAEEARLIFLAQPGGKYTERFEIDLTRGFTTTSERFRYGMRGTYFQVEICVQDTEGVGRVEIDGVFLRYTIMRESHPWARPFVGELEVDVELEKKRRFFFGTGPEDTPRAAIYEAEKGASDFGDRLRVWLEPNVTAPFGIGNEAWFRSLYLCITRTNRSDMSFSVTPILDNVPLVAQPLALTATDEPITEVHEIPLARPYEVSSIEQSTYGLRGVWFSYRIINTGTRPMGEIAVNGAAIEAIPLRETQPGSV